MGTLSSEQLDGLRSDLHSHDFLRRLTREIDYLQRVVFHAADKVEWKHARDVAEQILIAEIFSRHRGEIDGIYGALRESERSGLSWTAAIQNLAAYLHSYYTTPLGIVLRRELFGDAAVFLSPEAIKWVQQTAAAS